MSIHVKATPLLGYDILQYIASSHRLCLPTRSFSSSTLTSSQPNSLAILLQLGNELIALLDNIVVLLVLIIWEVGFDVPFAS